MEKAAPIIRLAETSSTNDHLARRWASPHGISTLPPFTAVIADHQSAGRGRLGRVWEAPSKTSLLMSVLVPVRDEQLSWLPLASGLAVQQSLSTLLPRSLVDLKWPNDVLVEGKKIAGILAEHLGKTEELNWVAVGIGVNVTQTEAQLPAVPSTSIVLEGGGATPILGLATSIIGNLRQLPIGAEIQSEYERNCVSVGSAVEVRFPDGSTLQGVGAGIDEDGALIVRDRDGDLARVQTGDVALIQNLPVPSMNGATLTAQGGLR